jgi:hypothetical protein
MKIQIRAAVAAVGVLISVSAARAATPLAYATWQNSDFGILNLQTAVFTKCGNFGFGGTGDVPAGLAVGPLKSILTEEQDTGVVYTVNPRNGDLTEVGPSGAPDAFGFGSTTKVIYQILPDQNVYTVNPSTGAATKIGNTGININDVTGISTGSKTLYITNELGLFSVNAKTGKATLVSTPASLGAPFYVGKQWYIIGNAGTTQLYTLNPATGGEVLIGTVSGGAPNSQIYGVAPAPAKAACGT